MPSGSVRDALVRMSLRVLVERPLSPFCHEDCEVEGLSCIADGCHVTVSPLGDESSV
jgi:hypothetical protein